MSTLNHDQIHGVALALGVDPDGPLVGVIVTGPSGAGKSRLALEVIDQCPWRRSGLIADDIVCLERHGAGVIAKAPDALRGIIEIRGFGPVPIRTAAPRPIRVVFELVDDSPRVPEKESFDAGGVFIPRLPFQLWHPAPVARLRHVVRSILMDN